MCKGDTFNAKILLPLQQSRLFLPCSLTNVSALIYNLSHLFCLLLECQPMETRILAVFGNQSISNF
jgi:hypothetical protein